MRHILSIASGEILRLRKRFRGGASPLAVVALLIGIGLSVLALRQFSLIGNGLYRLGVCGDVPPITDNRFTVTSVSCDQGEALLDEGAIDVFINGDTVDYRQEEKSLNALGALSNYLDDEEIARISQQEDPQTAFPLRVAIYSLTTSDSNQTDTGNEDTTASIQEESVVIPSLMEAQVPFSEVVLSLVYILPVTFISIFFTSSFMDEKLNRRLTILFSTPVTPIQIILGKMLPYLGFTLLSTLVIAIATNANLLLALAIFIPVILFIFAIYLMVPLFYRTFKDTTFISMLVTTLTTVYLVFPAMFNGVSDLAVMSPLTLAIKMYQGESFSLREYLFPSLPMAVIFGIALFAGTRLLNEEFLIGYTSISQKLKDAIFLMMDRAHPYRSVGILSLLLIPIVYLLQVVALAISTNLPANFMLVTTLFAAALVEEVVKSVGILVWFERRVITTVKQTLIAAFLSALGFLVGEKLLLLFSVTAVSQSTLSTTLFNSGFLLVPLFAHFVFTTFVTLLHKKARVPYILALGLGAVLHSIYNWALMGGI